MNIRFLNSRARKAKLPIGKSGTLDIVNFSGYLTRYYLAALTAIGLIAVLSHTVQMKSLDRDKDIAATINVSGRQRMLSQRIESLAEQYGCGDAEARDEMIRSIDELEKNHAQLSSEYFPAAGKGNRYQELHRAYFDGINSLDAQVRIYVQTARKVSSARPDDPALPALLSSMASQARTPLLNALDHIVTIHQRNSEETLASLKALQSILLLVMGLTLSLEAVLIFRPLVRKIVELSTRLVDQSITDHLTGVKNRKGFSEMASVEFQRSKRYRRALAVIALDIDHFKRVNDAFGHAAGDSVLRSVGAVLTSQMRPTDLLARVGGEEFAVMLPETSREDAVVIAERLRLAIAGLQIEHQPQTIQVTASFGVAGVHLGSANIDVAMRVADENLYLAKQSGRNCVRSEELKIPA